MAQDNSFPMSILMHQTSDFCYPGYTTRLKTNDVEKPSLFPSSFWPHYNNILQQLFPDIDSTAGHPTTTTECMKDIWCSNPTQYHQLNQQASDDGYIFSSDESCYELSELEQQQQVTTSSNPRNMTRIGEPLENSSQYTYFHEKSKSNASNMSPVYSLCVSKIPPNIFQKHLSPLVVSVAGETEGGTTLAVDSCRNIEATSADKTPLLSIPLVISKLGEASAPQTTMENSKPRTSIYRGVTKHKLTGRFEAHLWDSNYLREGQTRKGRQVYLGGYDIETKAARAYDISALKYWGPTTTLNFPISEYQKELQEMMSMTKYEVVSSLKRKSSGFSRGASTYRGVTRQHRNGRWQARIGRVAGNKDLYLGTFNTEEEAAEAYDIAAIKMRGLETLTNFDLRRYNIPNILSSNSIFHGSDIRRNLNSMEVYDMIKLGGTHEQRSLTAANLINNMEEEPTESYHDNIINGFLQHMCYPPQLSGNYSSLMDYHHNYPHYPLENAGQ